MNKESIQKYAIYALLAAVGGLGVYSAKPEAVKEIASIFNPESVSLTDPESPVQIVAPNEVRVGQLIRLEAVSDVAENYNWRVLPPTDNFKMIEDGDAAHFSAEAGVAERYTFIVAGVCDGAACTNTHSIVVTGGGRTGTNPLDVIPDVPGINLDNKILQWINQIFSSDKKREAGALAGRFKDIASRIRDGRLGQNPANYIDETFRSSRRVLGKSITAWQPFMQGIREELNLRATRGDLITPEDHAEVWTDIGRTLDHYSRS